jgi:hypothetical protein
MDILNAAKIKRAELMMVIGTLVDYYGSRYRVFKTRADRLKSSALAVAVVGILMLGTFLVTGGSSLQWMIFGMVSVAFTGVAAMIITFYEKRQERAKECLDRIGELHEFANYLREDVITSENAQARKRWYTIRIGILKSEYNDMRNIMGGIEFEELTAPPDVRSDNLIDTIDELSAAIATCQLSDRMAHALSADIADVAKGLAA